MSAATRSGFACLVGRPNVGKSTLVNALVGAKITIVSEAPQTTRRLVRAVLHRPDGQLVVVDTPGLHRPRNLLGERLGELVRAAIAEVDAVVLCVPADGAVGPGDRFLANLLAGSATPVVAAITRSDLASRDLVATRLLEVAALGEWAELVPVSAVSGEGLATLADLLMARMPVGEPLFPDGQLTDSPEEIVVAELIREQALVGVRQELPHSIAVTVSEIRRSPRLTEIDAVLWVERDSQKPIVIGRGGDRLKAVGTKARAHIEALLGERVFLDLRVKIAKDWQRDPKQLRRLGW
ncbi:MAG: GTPase Era [Mycobacteriales bacterium]